MISDFSSCVTNYTLSDIVADGITITALSTDTNARVSGTGYKELDYGVNRFQVIVTAENEETETYNLTINKIDNRSTNNNL